MYLCIVNYFYIIDPKSYRILQNNANYTAITQFKVIQGHSRSLTLVPIESPYATSY